MAKVSTKRAAQARAELGDLPAKLVEVAKLKGKALVDRFAEVVGEAPKSKNQQFLRKRIAIELQSKATGHPTPTEKARIKEVQEYALKKGIWKDVRNPETTAEKSSASKPTQNASTAPEVKRDPRLPAPGTMIERKFGNTTHKVTVLAEGFEYQGQSYSSLSKVAWVITGTTWNGFLFFGLTERKAK